MPRGMTDSITDWIFGGKGALAGLMWDPMKCARHDFNNKG
jgi:hypothetical protein